MLMLQNNVYGDATNYALDDTNSGGRWEVPTETDGNQWLATGWGEGLFLSSTPVPSAGHYW